MNPRRGGRSRAGRCARAGPRATSSNGFAPGPGPSGPTFSARRVRWYGPWDRAGQPSCHAPPRSEVGEHGVRRRSPCGPAVFDIKTKNRSEMPTWFAPKNRRPQPRNIVSSHLKLRFPHTDGRVRERCDRCTRRRASVWPRTRWASRCDSSSTTKTAAAKGFVANPVLSDLENEEEVDEGCLSIQVRTT